MKFYLVSNIFGEGFVLKGDEEFNNHIFSTEEAVQEAPFQRGDIVVDRHANRFEAFDYYYSTHRNEFQVGLKNTETGSSFYAADSHYELFQEFEAMLDAEEENSTKCCHKNPDCEIVESFTGCGGSLGEKFYYCRVHKEEVPESDAIERKPVSNGGFWF